MIRLKIVELLFVVAGPVTHITFANLAKQPERSDPLNK
jgi:hypothetical protein